MDNDESHQEILEIKQKLKDIHTDIKRFMENANQQHLEIVLEGSRQNISSAVIGHVIGDIEDDLDCGMVKKCEMRDTCKADFSAFLQKNAGLLKHNKVLEDVILENSSQLTEMKNNAPFNQCSKCFSEVQHLFGKQVGLMRSLQIYKSAEGENHEISQLSEDNMVTDVLEPLSNKQRLQILKAVSTETRTFSTLSELTGLRGGNLMFHLQKLMDTGMILQRHERGDYMITEKGFIVLKGINDIFSTLNS
ncbi:MAG TPA: winged helix-turn-helix domain-containing protein [archaeon]|nr:winged helix-turn-helix domain-containing protein [archaeon]